MTSWAIAQIVLIVFFGAIGWIGLLKILQPIETVRFIFECSRRKRAEKDEIDHLEAQFRLSCAETAIPSEESG